jgi:NAD(P)H-flavin reductase
VLELVLQDGLCLARIACPSKLIPAPGQHLLVTDGSGSILPVPLHYTDTSPDGFIAAPVPDLWIPGMKLFLRGPLGRGFVLPLPARRICLVAFDDSPARLRGLIRQALNQGGAVTFVTDSPVENLPNEVEIQPLNSLSEILAWADYAAFDSRRDNLPELFERLGKQNHLSIVEATEIFVHTPVPCGGIAECGVCAVPIKSGWKMACKDGPVFRMSDLLIPNTK